MGVLFKKASARFAKTFRHFLLEIHPLLEIRFL